MTAAAGLIIPSEKIPENPKFEPTMNLKRKIQMTPLAGAALALLVAGSLPLHAQELVAKGFDTDVQAFGGGWGADRSYTWDSALDALGSATSGSVKATVNFTSTEPNTTLQADLTVADYTAYSKVRLSVYVSPNDAPNTNGDYGSITVRLRPAPSWPWPGTEIPMGTITQTGWTHFEKSLPETPLATAGLNIHWNSGFSDTRSLWLDNLVFVPAPPPSNQTMVDSFETAVPTAANPPYTSITQSTESGVTEGSTAMKVIVDNTMTYEWIGVTKDAAAYSNFKSNKRILFDLHRAPQDSGANLDVKLALNGDGATWTETQLLNWQWFNGGTDYKTTYEFDYTAMRDAAPDTGTWFQVNLMFRSGGGATVYIDNIRFAGDPPAPPAAAVYTFDSDKEGFTTVSWGNAHTSNHSSNLGGVLACTPKAGFGPHVHRPLDGDALKRFIECTNRGGSVSFDLIAPAGVLHRQFIQPAFQSTSNWSWKSSGIEIDPAKLVSLPGGLELFRMSIPIDSLQPLATSGGYNFYVEWDSSTTQDIYFDNMIITPNGSNYAQLTFDSDVQGFVADGDTSSISPTANGVTVENPSGWDWSAKKNFTADDSDDQGKAIFEKLALAATNGGTLRFKVIEPYLSVRQEAFSGMSINVALGSPWQQQSALRIDKSSFVAAGPEEGDPPTATVVPSETTPTGFNRTVAIPLLPSSSSRTDGFKLTAGASAYEIWIGTDVSGVDVAALSFDDFEVSVNSSPQILHSPAVPANGSDPMVGRVLSNGEGTSTYSATGLPPGVSINPTTGLVLGTPSANGTYSVVFTVTSGAAHSSTEAVEWVVSGITSTNPQIVSFSYSGTQAVITWSGTGSTPVNVLRSQTMELGSWTTISSNDTDGTHTDTQAPVGKSFYRVEVP